LPDITLSSLISGKAGVVDVHFRALDPKQIPTDEVAVAEWCRALWQDK
jgi:hypothetical protein